MADVKQEPTIKDLKALLAAKKKDLKEAKDKIRRSPEQQVKDAQALIDKLFETWKQGGEWIHGQHRQGALKLKVVNPIGRVRHLPAYLHFNRRVHGAMDRRGPNSVIQGLASDIGFTAGYLAARFNWRNLRSQGLDIGFRQVNSVHDSSTVEVMAEYLPVASYIIEHAMTTLVMDYYEEVFGMKSPVPYGFDMEIGKSEDKLMKWTDQRLSSLLKIADEFGKSQSLPTKSLKALTHNIEAVYAVRMKELKEDPYKCTLDGKVKWFRKNLKGPGMIEFREAA